MNPFKKDIIFNDFLEGKAVRIKGTNRDGRSLDKIFLVTSTNYNYINVVDSTGDTSVLNIDRFLKNKTTSFLELNVIEEE